MKAIRVWKGAVLGALLGGSVALGQSTPLAMNPTPSAPVVTITTEPLPTSNLPAPVTPMSGTLPSAPPSTPNWLRPGESLIPSAPTAPADPAVAAPGPVEVWLNRNQPGCCGPVGGNGPVTYDLYLRSGPSFPIGGGTIAQALINGWSVRGGGRTLFFNPAGDAAWVLDGNIDFTRQHGNASKQLAFNGQQVILNGISRTSVGLAAGREWYAQAPGFVNGSTNYSNISWGFDAGARWGASHADLDRVRPQNPGVLGTRHYDVVGGPYGGFNLNYEKPMGGWTFIAGARLEGGMTFSQVLEGYGGTLYEINFLLTAGIRY